MNKNRFGEDELCRTRLTREKILCHLRREMRGAMIPLILCIPLLGGLWALLVYVLGEVSLPLTERILIAAIAAVLMFGLPLWMLGSALGRLHELRTCPITIRLDTVAYIEFDGVQSKVKWWKRSRHYGDMQYFTGGGRYLGCCSPARDGAGDEYYVVFFDHDPGELLTVYRTTEYEWIPD